jgi:hypothetical protein
MGWAYTIDQSFFKFALTLFPPTVNSSTGFAKTSNLKKLSFRKSLIDKINRFSFMRFSDTKLKY